MKKRQRKKQAYKKYIRDIFEGYESMVANPKIEKLEFGYLNEETVIYRDQDQQIHFLSRDRKINSK